ncbi:iron ABC transporter permease [bacterium]|nr:iron ABC transporter permease [bacterium]
MTRRPLTLQRWFCLLGIYAAAAALAVCIAPWFGYMEIDAGAVVRETLAGHWSVGTEVFWQQRMPRVALAALVGGALGLAGAVFQVMLRNPLATPDTLGVSSAGTLAASLPLVFPSLAWRGGSVGAPYVFALAGSAAAAVFIYVLARRGRAVSVPFLLLAGVSVNLFCGSALLLVRFLADPFHLVAVDRWMMGGLVTIGRGDLLRIAPFAGAGAALLLSQAYALNQLAFGHELAGARGVNINRLLSASFIGCVMLTASVVAVAGPIGFVGLIVPHAVRLLSGPDHRVLLPASALAGAALLVACDTLARTIVAPTEIPVGVITACLGAPVFLALLLHYYKRHV